MTNQDTATLTSKDCHGGRQVMLDCPHGSTGAIVAGGTLPDAAIVRTVLATHYAAEGRACRRTPRRRYGVDVSHLEGRR